MSVITRMLQDLEARGVTPSATPAAMGQNPVQRIPAQDANTFDTQGLWRRLWLGTALLMGALGVYNLMQAPDALRRDAMRPARLAPVAAKAQTVGAQPALPLGTASGWRIDSALSLQRLKAAEPANAMQAAGLTVSLSPYEDWTTDAPDAPQPPLADPPVPDAQKVAQAKLQADKTTVGTSGPLLIDPPAAGRVQSSANAAVQAYRQAQDFLDQGRDGLALDAALHALELDAQHAPARRLAAGLLLNQNRAEQAQALIQEGLQQDPRDAELLYQHARLLAANGALEQALAALQNLDKPGADAWGLKAGLLARTGQYAPAVVAYEQALKARPDNATWWLGLGVALHAQGQTAGAKTAFERARRLGQLSPDVQAWVEQQL